MSRFCFVTTNMSENNYWSHLLLHRLIGLSLLPPYPSHCCPRLLLVFRFRLARPHHNWRQVVSPWCRCQRKLRPLSPVLHLLTPHPRVLRLVQFLLAMSGGDRTSPPASESPKRFHDGMKTRSGHQVTLTEKARAAYG